MKNLLSGLHDRRGLAPRGALLVGRGGIAVIGAGHRPYGCRKALAVGASALALVVASADRAAATEELELPQVTVEAGAGGAAADSAWRGFDPVTGYRATMATSASRLPLPLSETPYSVSVVTRDLIRDRDARTMSQALETVAGFSRSFINNGVEIFSLRGFDSRSTNVRAENGLAVGSLVTPDRSSIERWEVLKGPASILAGGQSAGGAVNHDVKRAQRDRFFEGGASYGAWNRARVEMDANGGLVPGGSLRGRFAAAFENGDGFVRGARDRTHALSPSLGFDVFDGTGSVDLVFRHQRTDGVRNPGLPLTVDGKVPDISRARGIYGTGGSFKSGRDSIFVNYEQALPDDLKFTGRFQYTDSSINRRDILAESAIRADGTADITADFADLERDSYAGEISLAKSFDAWGRSHDVIAGINHHRVLTGIRAGWTGLGADNVFNPSANFAMPSIPLIISRQIVEEQTGAFAQANIRPLDGLTLVGAVRHDWYTATFTNQRNNQASTGDSKSFTYRLGASYEVLPGTTLYGSYADSFVPQNHALGRDGKPLAPETGQQFEAGVKQEFLGGRLYLTGSVFHIRRQNVARRVGPGVSETVGEQTHKGFELEANGRVTDSVNLVASYSYVDARITRDASGAASRLGQRPIHAPAHIGSLWVHYAPVEGPLKRWSLGLGAHARSAMPVASWGNSSAPFMLPGYIRVDAQVGYQITESVKATLHVENLFDAKYIANPGWQEGYNQFGAPFNVVGRVGFRF